MRAVCVAVFIVALACLTQARPTFQARSLKLADSWKKGDWKKDDWKGDWKKDDWKKGGCPSWKKDCNGDKEFSFAFEETSANGFAASTANAEADANIDDDADSFSETSGFSLFGSTTGTAAAFDTNEGNKAFTIATQETQGILAGASSDSTATADDDDATSESNAEAGVLFAGTASAATLGAAKNDKGEKAITGAKVDVVGKGFGEAHAEANDHVGTTASSKSVSKGGHVSSKSFAIQKDP